jgi:hypothetical protein
MGALPEGQLTQCSKLQDPLIAASLRCALPTLNLCSFLALWARSELLD